MVVELTPGRSAGEVDVLLVVIGPRWLQTIGDAPDARSEIVAAIERGRFVIPVLVDEARPPAPGDLPPELAPLAERNALELVDSTFVRDVGHLRSQLEHVLSPAPGVGTRGSQGSLISTTAYAGRR